MQAPPPVSTQRAHGESRKIRVMQLSYGHALYGAERWVLMLAKHLDEARVETVVACIRDADTSELPLIDEARRLGFKTSVIDGTRRLLWSSIRGLRAALKEQKVDVLHTHGVRQDFVGLAATVGLHCATLSTPHGWEVRTALKERVRTAVNKLCLSGFEAIAPLSEGLLEELRGYPISTSKVHLIGNGVDLSEVEGAQPASGSPLGGFPEGAFVVGYIGRLVAGKGVDLLLRALALQKDPSWGCLLIGEGPEQKALECLAADLDIKSRVAFLGYRPDRLSFLKRFDLFVLPSYSEGTPRCVMEALAAGVPCAGSAIPGIEKVIHDGVTGDTFPAGDPARLAEVITAVRTNREEASRKAAAGRALVYDVYSARAMAQAYEKLFETLVAKRG